VTVGVCVVSFFFDLSSHLTKNTALIEKINSSEILNMPYVVFNLRILHFC